MLRAIFLSGFRAPYAILLLVSLALAGCSNDPNDTGKNLLSPADTLKFGTLQTTSTSGTSFLYRITGTSNDLIGTYQDLQARTLLQFSGILSIPSNARIDSAVLTIYAPYRFKDSSGTIGFFVHRMLRSWTAGSFSWDTSLIPGTYAVPADTSFLGVINAGDTAVSARIDNVVRSWISAGIDAPDGIILIPDSISTNIVIGSGSIITIDTRPLLTVVYHDSLDSVQTFSARTLQREYIANRSVVQPPPAAFLQAGVGYRSLLRFDSLPLPPRASITQALLEIPVDNSSTLLNASSRDTIIAYLARKNTAPYDSLALSTVCSPSFESGVKIYSADIKSIVQVWVTREPNYGIVLQALGETYRLDRFTLYPSSSPVNLRPRLKITYTILP